MVEITTSTIFGEAANVLIGIMNLVNFFLQFLWGISMGKIIISLTLVSGAIYLGRTIFLRWGRRTLMR